MAMSGSFSNSINNKWIFKTDWYVANSEEDRIANNRYLIHKDNYLVLVQYASLYIGERNHYGDIDGQVTYYSSGAISSNGNQTIYLGSEEKYVYANDDGSKYLEMSGYFDLRATLSGTYYASITNSTGVWLDTIPRASSISGGSGNIGSKVNINISRASSSFTHKIYYAFGNIGKTLIASGVGTSLEWTIPTSFYAQIPNSNSGTGTLYCETYNGNNKIGEKTISFTAYVTNSDPIFTSSKVSYKDNNSTITNITNDNQLIVRNLSTLNIIIEPATAQNSATISHYELIFNNTSQNVQSGTTNLGTVNLSQSTELIVRAVDSRGNKTEVKKTINIVDWVLPIANITAKRVNNFENDTNLKVNASISSVNGINSIQSIKYRYKKTTDTNYSSYIYINNNENEIVEIDKLYAWNIQVVIQDKFGSTTYNLIVQKGIPIMFIDIDKLSIGIGKFPVNNNSLDTDIINGENPKLSSYPVGSIYMNTLDGTNPALKFGGTWVQLTDRFLIGAGSTYGVGATGGSTLLQSHNHTGGTSANGQHNHSLALNEDSNYVMYGTLNWGATYTGFVINSINSNGQSSGKSFPLMANYNGNHSHTFTTNHTGGGNAENMPPYRGVYMWYRSA